MAAFTFPNPTEQQTVTNPLTGVTYKWVENPGKWVLTTQANQGTNEDITQLQQDVSELEDALVAEEGKRHTGDQVNLGLIEANKADIEALEARPLAKDYIIGTDQNISRISEPRSRPAIELVDSDLNFSNVRFEATGGIAVTSTASSIVIDGSNIQGGSGVNPDNYYTKDEIDNQFTLRGVGYVYLLSSIGGYAASRPGEFHTDNRIAGQITAISMAPVDEQGKNRRDAVPGDKIELYEPISQKYYRYTITGGASGTYFVEYEEVDEDRNDQFGLGQPFNIYLYPSHINSANFYTKVESDSRFITSHFGNKQIIKSELKLENDAEYHGQIEHAKNIAHKGYVDSQIAGAISSLATIDYVNDEVDKFALALAAEDGEPDIHYGDYSPQGERINGDIWFDSMNLRLNVWSQGSWVNPDRNDGQTLENRITTLEARLAQLEGN